MLAQSIAGPFNLNHHGMMEQAIQQRGGYDGIAEDLAPFGKTAVRGEDHRALFVASINELEEEIAAALADRQVTDFVDDQERKSAEPADAFGELAFALSLGESTDQVCEGGEVDAAPRFDGFDAERHREMRFAGARRSSDILPGVRVLKSRSAIPFTPAVAKPSQCSGSSAMLAVNTLSSGNPIGHCR